MAKVIVDLFLVLVCVQAIAGASTLVRDHGYLNRLTVSIDENVPRHLCSKTIRQLEDLLTETSRSLHSLTSGQLQLGSILINLPKSWINSDCVPSKVNLTSIASTHEPDLIITGERSPMFGDYPFAVQYGQCQVQGQNIQLSYTGLTANDTLSQLMLDAMFKEFVKYHFGVFEETGFDGDILYPRTYLEGETEKLNRACNDSESIICPDGIGYNSDITTKQNILCDGRSILQVIQASLHPNTDEKGDLGLEPVEEVQVDLNVDTDVKKKNKNFRQIFHPPTFDYIMPRPKLFVLILDRSDKQEKGQQLRRFTSPQEDSSSSGMSDLNSTWETLQQALLSFMSKLPLDSHISIITYSKQAELNLSPTPITATNVEGLHGRIPRRTAQDSGGEPCLDCALNLAFKVMNMTEDRLGSPNSFDSQVIVVSQSSSTARLSDETQMKIVKNALPVNAILLKSDDGIDEGLDWATKFAVMSSDPNLKGSSSMFLNDLTQILTTVIQSTTDRHIMNFHRERILMSEQKAGGEGNDLVLSGNFIVEERLRRNVWIVLTVEDERDIEKFEVLSPTGKKHSFPQFENRLALFFLEGINEPGIWSYKVQLYQPLHYPIFVDVSGEPEPQKPTIAIHTWVRKVEQQVMVYASVKQGELPVNKAQVTATVSRPGHSNEDVQVTLRDTGMGYPDITKGDGIYSGYFTDFSAESGYYQVTVSANDNSGLARTPKLSANIDADDNLCCGSQMPLSYSIPTGPFERFAVGSSFFIDQVSTFYIRQHQDTLPHKRLVNDIFPPSRIIDFKVENYVEDSLFVNLKWTAPGGDYDQGKAFRYEIRCYTNKEALRDANFAEMSIPVHPSLVPQPEMNGYQQRCTVGIPWPNEVFYYAVVAYDEAGNRGKISNVISVFIKETPSTSAKPLEDFGNENKDLLSPMPLMDNNFKITFIAIGVSCGFILIIVIVTLIIIKKHCVIRQKTETDIEFEKGDSMSDTLKKFILPNRTELAPEGDKGASSIWQGNSSPTSDYSSQKSPLPSISETLSWHVSKQRATSQEIPAIHRVLASPEKSFIDNLDSQQKVVVPPQQQQQQTCDVESRAATHSTDCSLYECSSNNSSGHENSNLYVPDSPGFQSTTGPLAPRISILEDFSIYRDLSHLSQNDYFSFNCNPNSNGHIIMVPPHHDMNTLDSNKNKRHESLV